MIPLVARGLASLAGRLIARNPRLGKKIFELIKKPAHMTVFRGEPAIPTQSLASLKKEMGASAGRWFSSDPKLAMRFAGKSTFGWRPIHWKTIWQGGPSGFGYQKGVVKKLKLSMKEADVARRLASYPSKSLLPDYEYLVVPRHSLPRVEKDAIRTAVANLRKVMGMYKSGGLAQIMNV